MGTAVTSGGGFSVHFPQPKYQAASVDGYMRGNPGLPAALFNPHGRAYPDISMLGATSHFSLGSSAPSGSKLPDAYLGVSGSVSALSSIVATLNDGMVCSHTILTHYTHILYGPPLDRS
jgi:tripeptidyl-peptidase-1